MRSLLLTLFIIVNSTLYLKAETAVIVTKENALRADCKFFSPLKSKVRYNDVIDVLSQQGDWYKVRFQGTEGCIHKSAIEKKSVSLSNLVGVGNQSASAEEVALAGKGFNPQVEKEYKEQNLGLNYSSVNKIEEYEVSEMEIRKFIENGKLNMP